MSGRLVIAPASDANAWPNFEHSMLRGVAPETFDHLGAEQRRVATRHVRRGVVRLWGSRSNKDKVWEDVRRGDVLLFWAQKRFLAAGTVAGKIRDEQIADAVWRPVPGSWHNVLFLAPVHQLDLPASAIGALLGYEPTWYPREFYIPRPAPQAQALEAYAGLDDLLASLTGESALRGDDGYTSRLGMLQSPDDVEQLVADLRARASDGIPATSVATTKRIRRDATIVLKLKKLYDGKCQVCGDTFPTIKGINYCEAAHIVALERRLPGIDSHQNIVILCATCHRKLDHGGMRIFWDPGAKRAMCSWQGQERPLLHNKHINEQWAPPKRAEGG